MSRSELVEAAQAMGVMQVITVGFECKPKEPARPSAKAPVIGRVVKRQTAKGSLK